MNRVADLDPIIHQHVRLRIMAALARNRSLRFTTLRDRLQLTDGNLANHAARLEEAGYLNAPRILTRHGFELHYRITPTGAAAFHTYSQSLLSLLDDASDTPPDTNTTKPPHDATRGTRAGGAGGDGQ